ncbi:MAG TPA: hypothetical protein VHN98_09250 [Acidimicrobiales bacterium]|nr:hypothetical protein [Acidimicrobiales bacterium]
MGRASSTKKVARAAGTGGGRTKGGQRPWVWWGAMALVVVLGFYLIWLSRSENRTHAVANVDKTPPQIGDHWHAAYGVYLCDAFAEPIKDTTDPHGIHTHGDGVIHVHPADTTATGKNANLGKFADAVKMTLTDTEIKMPGGKAYKEGDTKCGDKPGIVQVKVNDTQLVTTDVRGIRLKDGDLLTIAFAPEGATLPVTPSAPNLSKLEDVTTTTAPGATTTTGAGETTTTTAPDTTTTAPATTTTAKK